MKVLYNDCYGDFAFSVKFMAEYKVRAGRELDMSKALFHTGALSIRCDPVAIAIVAEHGVEWSSAPDANITIYEFPDVFAHYWEIESYAGNESVHLNVSDAIADILHTFMDMPVATRDLAALERQYRAIMDAVPQSYGTVEQQTESESKSNITRDC
jgi:hypothetical protein